MFSQTQKGQLPFGGGLRHFPDSSVGMAAGDGVGVYICDDWVHVSSVAFALLLW